MEETFYSKLISLQLETFGNATISIEGSSMMPTLNNGDVVTISKSEAYKSGDILVYWYKGNNIIAHRLLFVKNNKYYCKGDNSFKIEDVRAFQIIGKVLLVNDTPPIQWSNYKLQFSHYIGRLFRHFRYDISKVTNSELYKHYKSTVLSEDILDLTYGINVSCTVSEHTNERICIHAPHYKNKFIFDGLEAKILKVLQTPQSINKLLNLLGITNNDILDKELTYAFLAKAIYLKLIIRF